MRHLHISGLAATAAAALLGLTLAAAPAGAGLPDDKQRVTLPVPTTSTVRLDQLGEDSVVAVVSHGNFDQLYATGLGRSLEVITADGVRHPVYSVDLRESRAGWHRGDFSLADWRPELHTALLRVSLGADGDKLVSYDVTTGATREVAAPRMANTVGLAPDGSGVLMTSYRRNESRAARVAVLGWDGVRTWLTAHGDGSAITSADGTTLVTTYDRQWWVTDLAARTTRAVDTPGYCTPHRWSADSLIATCHGRRLDSQLRLVDLDGASSPLGIRHTEGTRRRGAPIFNDDDVRSVQGRSWFESYGGCGGGILTRQTPTGVARLIRISGRDGALTLVGARGDGLLIAVQRTECGSWPDRAVLSTFDPVSRTETVLTRLRRTESWREVISATEVRSWIW